jgi:hypothetical protein
VPFANTTSTTGTPSPLATNCCFIVQDVVTEFWWQSYSTKPVQYSVDLTSITTLITPYADTTITNYETHVYTTNGSYTATDAIRQNPIQLFLDSAPQPDEKQHILFSSNGTQIVTAGVTM